VYVVTPSETARRTIDAQSPDDKDELAKITYHIEHFLPVLLSDGLVKPFTFFGIDGLRYFDSSWPYLILMEIVAEPSNGTPGDIHLHLILPATTNPPTQARV